MRTITLVLFIFISLSLPALILDGFAFLEQQIDHTGISVNILRLENMQFYNTITPANGYYNITIPSGTYNISFQKTGYYNQFPFTNYEIAENTTLPDITLFDIRTLIEVPEIFSTIQEALNVANDGDTILVAPGVYNENLNIYNWNLKLVSHFFSTGNENYITNTIIDGQDLNQVINFSGFYCLISGFTIRNGNAQGDWTGDQCGGGIYIESESQAVFDHLVITNNNAELNGGGIYCNIYSSPTFQYVTISNNSATSGGGMAFENFTAPILRNIICWNNDPPLTFTNNPDLTASYSDIEGGFAGTAIIEADPLFADQEANDYHLTWQNFPVADETKSPCIDSGDPTLPSDPDGTISDMGTYYFDQLSPPTLTIYTLFNNASHPDDSLLHVSCVIGPDIAITTFTDLNCRIQGDNWFVLPEATTQTSNFSFDALFDFFNHPNHPLPSGDWDFWLDYTPGDDSLWAEHPFRIENVDSIPTIDILSTTNNGSDLITVTVQALNVAVENISDTGMGNSNITVQADSFFTSNPTTNTLLITSIHNLSRFLADFENWFIYTIFGKNEFEYNTSDKLAFPGEMIPNNPVELYISVESGFVCLSWSSVPESTYNVYSSSTSTPELWEWNLEASGLSDTTWSCSVDSINKFFVVTTEKQD